MAISAQYKDPVNIKILRQKISIFWYYENSKGLITIGAPAKISPGPKDSRALAKISPQGLREESRYPHPHIPAAHPAPVNDACQLKSFSTLISHLNNLKKLHFWHGMASLMPVKTSQLGWLANAAGCRLLVVEVREGTQA